jgi:polysaccharide export outer membrane protein
MATGCQLTYPHHMVARNEAQFHPDPEMPKELAKVSLATYVIEPPDILVVDALYSIPKQPYGLRTGDMVHVRIYNIPNLDNVPDDLIDNDFIVQPGGAVNLGAYHGKLSVANKTIDQVQQMIVEKLTENFTDPKVDVSLVELSGAQQVQGQHLVGPDGTITLGSYGSVSVAGLHLNEAKQVIENHLSRFLEDPEVSVDVAGYNSKVYYVITEGGGLGDGVTRFPITGNETVLDAIANINGLTSVSSKKIWIARPSPHCDQATVLPVDWRAVAATGAASSNYQIMPGDRIFIAEDRLIAFDTKLAKFLAPMERAMGFTLLSAGTATRLSGPVMRGGGARGVNNGGGGF